MMIKQHDAEFGRIPDVRSRFGIPRSKRLYELINEGKIKSASIRKKGARTGVRLIDLASVRAFVGPISMSALKRKSTPHGYGAPND